MLQISSLLTLHSRTYLYLYFISAPEVAPPPTAPKNPQPVVKKQPAPQPPTKLPPSDPPKPDVEKAPEPDVVPEPEKDSEPDLESEPLPHVAPLTISNRLEIILWVPTIRLGCLTIRTGR